MATVTPVCVIPVAVPRLARAMGQSTEQIGDTPRDMLVEVVVRAGIDYLRTFAAELALPGADGCAGSIRLMRTSVPNLRPAA